MQDEERTNNENKLRVETVLKISKKIPKAYIMQGSSCARCDINSTCSVRGSLAC